MFDVHDRKEHGVEQATHHRCGQAGTTERNPDQDRVQCTQQHEPDPGDRQRGRVSDQSGQCGERGQGEDDPRRMQEQHIAIRQQTVHQPGRRSVVDAVVVVPPPIQTAAVQDGKEPQQERRRGDQEQ